MSASNTIQSEVSNEVSVRKNISDARTEESQFSTEWAYDDKRKDGIMKEMAKAIVR